MLKIRTIWKNVREEERKKEKRDEQQITMPEEARQLYNAR